ncbi:hypothetical protein TNCV_2543231 [Trichonephila clavipes]|nr:hypothetical protein TNCV_2543231 [Trichonephila clavipes]
MCPKRLYTDCLETVVPVADETEIPAHLSTLDLVSEILISPRTTFMQIRGLRHVHGQLGILGQVINVPTSSRLPIASTSDVSNKIDPPLEISSNSKNPKNNLIMTANDQEPFGTDPPSCHSLEKKNGSLCCDWVPLATKI